MAKTIADLGIHHEDKKPVVVGKDMTSDPKSIEKKIEDYLAKQTAEDALVEAAGYDYGGTEDWERAMRNVGRM